jgi:hypothetical protein
LDRTLQDLLCLVRRSLRILLRAPIGLRQLNERPDERGVIRSNDFVGEANGLLQMAYSFAQIGTGKADSSPDSLQLDLASGF